MQQIKSHLNAFVRAPPVSYSEYFTRLRLGQTAPVAAQDHNLSATIAKNLTRLEVPHKTNLPFLFRQFVRNRTTRRLNHVTTIIATVNRSCENHSMSSFKR